MDKATNINTQVFLQIVIDIGYPMTIDNLQHVLNALKNVLAVGYSLQSGGEAAYCFGFSSMSDVFQTIAPFKMERNFATTWSILKELLNMIRSTVQITMVEYEDMIHLAIKSLIEEFNLKQKLMKSKQQSKSFVEVLIITRKSSFNFNKCIEKITENLNINQLKNIQIMKLTENDSEEEPDEESENEISSLINNVTVRIDNELDNHFKKCLFHSCYSLGEMILFMPNKTISCDITFFFINPNCKLDMNKVYKMEVVNRLSDDGLCESHIYGDPMRVTPSCKTENWEQHLVNRQAFRTLCQHLDESEEYLIVRQKNSISFPTYDFFVLRPGVECMLMKSVYSGEMFLPSPEKRILTDEDRVIQTDWEIISSLRHISRVEVYKPNHFLSGLLPSLLSQPVATGKQGSTLVKRNQYNKLDTLIQIKNVKIQQKIDGESSAIIVPGDHGEPTNKKRMLLPLDTQSSVNLENHGEMTNKKRMLLPLDTQHSINLENHGETTNKKRMLLPLNSEALINLENLPDVE